MKTIYSIYYSTEGLSVNAYSNKKALFNALSKNLNYYNCEEITYTKFTNDGQYKNTILKFNYSNIVKAFSEVQCITLRSQSTDNTITIQELDLYSK